MSIPTLYRWVPALHACLASFIFRFLKRPLTAYARQQALAASSMIRWPNCCGIIHDLEAWQQSGRTITTCYQQHGLMRSAYANGCRRYSILDKLRHLKH